MGNYSDVAEHAIIIFAIAGGTIYRAIAGVTLNRRLSEGGWVLKRRKADDSKRRKSKDVGCPKHIGSGASQTSCLEPWKEPKRRPKLLSIKRSSINGNKYTRYYRRDGAVKANEGPVRKFRRFEDFGTA